LIQGVDGDFYGTTGDGGAYGSGTVFRVTSAGALTTLFSFAGTNGSSPAPLMQGSDGRLYGTTFYGGDVTGGALGSGTVYRITTNGQFVNLHFFISPGPSTPFCSLIEVSNGVFYGTTYSGQVGSEAFAGGSLFQITSDGDFTKLLQFDSSYGKPSSPLSGVTKGVDGNFYGFAQYTGVHGNLFCVRPIEAPIVQASFQANQICVKWKAFGGCYYNVVYKADLNDPEWQNVSSLLIPQTNGIISYSEPVELDPHRFYRVNLGLPEH